MDNNELLTAALEYAAAGFRVIPLKPRDKAPLVPKWTERATADPTQIRQWWQKYPNANIGIACGAACGRNLTVVDLDVSTDKNGLRELYDWQKEHGELPKTLTVKTGGGGYHYYYFTDSPHKIGANILGAGSGVDVRDAGGQIVAPPSIHKSGKRYEWADGFDISRIADGGALLEKLLTERETGIAAPTPLNSRAVDVKPISGDITDRITAKLGLDFSEGGRNDSIHRLASSLQARGYEDGTILELCERVNSERCTPPLPEKEVQTAVASALKSIGKGMPRTVDAVADFAEYSERLADKFPYIIPHEQKDGTIYYTVSPQRLAAYMRAYPKDKYFFLETGGEKPLAFWYNGAYYNPLDDNSFKGYIKRHIAEFDEELIKTRDLDEVYKLLVTDGERVKAGELDNAENLICFKNGLLNIDTLGLVPNTPELYCTIQIPCNWTPGAECPRFMEYLKTLTNGNFEFQTLLWQFMGLAISNLPGYLPKKALFLYGDGDTGKSQLLELIKRLIGSENYASTDMKELERPHGTYSLWRKRLAGSPDMSAMRVDELKMFKKLTGGDDISFEKKFKDAFTDKYKGVLLFCANVLPPFGGDKGDHVYERMILCPCTNVIPPEKRDRRLIEKLYAEREGIVYNAVMALRELKENGFNFTIPDICRLASEEYKRENDSVLQFLDECTVPREHCDSSLFTPTGAMYAAYKGWAKMNNCRYIANRSEFRQSIRNKYGNRMEVKDKSGNKRGYTFELTRAAREELGGFFNYAE